MSRIVRQLVLCRSRIVLVSIPKIQLGSRVSRSIQRQPNSFFGFSRLSPRLLVARLLIPFPSTNRLLALCALISGITWRIVKGFAAVVHGSARWLKALHVGAK